MSPTPTSAPPPPPELVVGFWRAVAKWRAISGSIRRGYRIVANHGANSGQTVFHFHVHIFAGKPMPHDMTKLPRADAKA